jgi:hypothetical protein
MENQTQRFLGQPYNWSKASIRLEDVQPLFGGVRVYLPGWTMSQMFVTRVNAAGQEEKYRIPLGWQEKAALCQLFVDQDFLTIQPEERLGAPDEARPGITLTNRQNVSHEVSKWQGVENGRFDTIYQALLALAERSQGHKPIPPRFTSWQKGAVIGGLALLFLLLLGLAYGLAAALADVLWPERAALLLALFFLLLGTTPFMLRGLAWRERRKSREDRLFSNPPVNVVLGLLFFVALICGADLVWAMLKGWRTAVPVTSQDLVWQYALAGWTALLAIWLVALAAAAAGPRVLALVDERF